ncbi:MAG: hypothetical protein LBK76_06940 [Verrucomicrobiales bacterium]|nr:hypothetical protein [Verrucomicrobiales bacterium]
MKIFSIALALMVTVSGAAFAQDAEFERRQNEWQKKFELGQTEWRGKIDAVYQAWLGERNRDKKDELENEITHAVIHRLFDRYELLDQIAAGGKFREGEIKVPPSAATVTVQKIRVFGANADRGIDYGHGRAWVIRRMTKKHFELWSPKRGWLFAADGALLNTAGVPRRDGDGRGWYGAFLADGSWVTTDIWDMDRTLHFYSRAGKWLKEMSVGQLLKPVPMTNDANGLPRTFDSIPLIAWCRVDRKGENFLVSIGSDLGLGLVRVSADSAVLLLKNPRRECYPRDLEPKGTGRFNAISNDDGKVALSRSEAGHGAEVGFPDYNSNKGLAVIIREGISNAYASSFGFWPDSDNVYINADSAGEVAPDGGPVFRHRGNMCWFFRTSGKFAGWVQAARLADADDGESMLFDAGRGKVVTISDDFKVTAARQFRWPDGGAALPEKIFPDLKLGFFWDGQELILARWR